MGSFEDHGERAGSAGRGINDSEAPMTHEEKCHSERRELEAEIARLKASNKILRRAVLRLAHDGDITISKANELLGDVSFSETRRQVFALAPVEDWKGINE